jgi:hypothetical protein
VRAIVASPLVRPNPAVTIVRESGAPSPARALQKFIFVFEERLPVLAARVGRQPLPSGGHHPALSGEPEDTESGQSADNPRQDRLPAIKIRLYPGLQGSAPSKPGSQWILMGFPQAAARAARFRAD